MTTAAYAAFNKCVLEGDRSSVWTTQERAALLCQRQRSRSPTNGDVTMIPAPQPDRAGESFAASNYWQRLHPWCIIRLLPKMQRIVIQRFRSR
ncbi:hypothetical protein [Phormidesmis sp. 146-12]